MALNVPGLIVMAVFYLVILGTGIWASLRSRKEEKKCTGDGMEITLLAGRKISLLVGIFTLTGNHLLQPLMSPSHASSRLTIGMSQQRHGWVEDSSWALLRPPTTPPWALSGLLCLFLTS